MNTLSLSIFLYFTDISWEESALTVLSLNVVYQIVFNFLGTLQVSMASMYGLPKAAPSPTHATAVVTRPTLWWCTSHQDPCLTPKFLTLYPKYINTAVLYLLINPPHNSLTKVGLTDTKPRNLVNC